MILKNSNVETVLFNNWQQEIFKEPNKKKKYRHQSLF